ncbi:acyl-CoA N-acyltransferase [Naematelia encephala]|uniref:Acyl-CoA N-acyltransferase n=1 Tax=Naematelia encephala TaxID=71784 RepID=A0A1Y2AWN4_9TREE|nr:acyl-CoA N-acyltransferase [Naematelia encephala]
MSAQQQQQKYSRPAYEIIKVSTPEELSESMAIRYEVFIEEQGYDPQIEVDDYEDPISTHFLLRLETGEFAGTVRVQDKRGKLGRLALRKAYRGMGLAKPLCYAVHDYIRGIGGKEIIADAQASEGGTGVNAVGFYDKLGYYPRGEKWVKVGTPHQLMVFDLTK